MEQVRIPEKYLVTCIYCHDALNARQHGVYRRGTGWMRNRKTGGAGTNSATLVEWTEQYACQFCIHKMNEGIPVNQMELFHLPLEDE